MYFSVRVPSIYRFQVFSEFDLLIQLVRGLGGLLALDGRKVIIVYDRLLRMYSYGRVNQQVD